MLHLQKSLFLTLETELACGIIVVMEREEVISRKINLQFYLGVTNIL